MKRTMIKKIMKKKILLIIFEKDIKAYKNNHKFTLGFQPNYQKKKLGKNSFKRIFKY